MEAYQDSLPQKDTSRNLVSATGNISKDQEVGGELGAPSASKNLECKLPELSSVQIP